MTYEEIEAVLKKSGRNSTIERLRVAVGEEASEITKKGDSPRVDLAREYYADSITKWVKEGGSPDPIALLEHRSRYVTSWAFATIITDLQGGDEEGDEEDDDRVQVGDAVLLRICDANSQLGLGLLQLVQTVREMSEQVVYPVVLERIKEALDVAGAPSLNEMGNRNLEVDERVESVLVEYMELRAAAAQKNLNPTERTT